MSVFKKEIYNFIKRNMNKFKIGQNDVNTFTQLDGWKYGYHIMNIQEHFSITRYLHDLESVQTVIEQQK